jgi:hypothetical protein
MAAIVVVRWLRLAACMYLPPRQGPQGQRLVSSLPTAARPAAASSDDSSERAEWQQVAAWAAGFTVASIPRGAAPAYRLAWPDAGTRTRALTPPVQPPAHPDKVALQFARSRGPGGQNVNKGTLREAPTMGPCTPLPG